MTARIITVANLKGGVGKTTTSYAICSAAVAEGLRVITLDLDPTGGLSNALEKKGQYPATIYHVLQGDVQLRDALVDHPLGRTADGRSRLRIVPADKRLEKKQPNAELLKSILVPILEEADLIIIDTQPVDEEAIRGPLIVADYVIIPTILDMLSLRASAMTVAFMQALDIVHKLKGLVVTNAKRPLATMTSQLLSGLQMNQLSFETVLWYTVGWVKATSGRGEMPEDELLEMAKRLLNEILNRPAPVGKWQGFLQLARRPEVRNATVPQ